MVKAVFEPEAELTLFLRMHNIALHVRLIHVDKTQQSHNSTCR